MKKTFPTTTSLLCTLLGICGCLAMLFIVAQQCWQLHWALGLLASVCEFGFVMLCALFVAECHLLTEESADDEIENN